MISFIILEILHLYFSMNMELFLTNTENKIVQGHFAVINEKGYEREEVKESLF